MSFVTSKCFTKIYEWYLKSAIKKMFNFSENIRMVYLIFICDKNGFIWYGMHSMPKIAAFLALQPQTFFYVDLCMKKFFYMNLMASQHNQTKTYSFLHGNWRIWIYHKLNRTTFIRCKCEIHVRAENLIWSC